MPHHDFGTVLMFETAGRLEVDMLKGDAAAQSVTGRFRGRFNRDTKRTTVDPAAARTTTAKVVEAMRAALAEAAPPAWNKALPKLRKAAVTTGRYLLVVAEGGVRLRLRPGHRHEYLLRSLKDAKAFQTFEARNEWRIHARHCVDRTVMQMLVDMQADDREDLSLMVDYMAGYALVGTLDLVDGEAARLGLAEGATVFANPSFVRKADPRIPRERLPEYPFRVVSLAPAAGGGTAARLAFATGEAGWMALRERYSQPAETRVPTLDIGNVSGTWERRRG